MAGKIFVNYRRGDARDMAARIRDRLALAFGEANVFMDVDNLMAGQRFDKELEKALAETDVLIAVIGPRWMELLAERQASGERDYVEEEIAGALARGIVVIPVVIEQTPLPRAADLPEAVRDLVLYQKHAVGHEQFGRDVAALVEAIRFARKGAKGVAFMPRVGAPPAMGWARWAGVGAVAALGVLAYVIGFVGLDTRPTVTVRDVTPKAASPAKPDPDRAAREAARRAQAEGRIKVLVGARDRQQARWLKPGAGKVESFKDCDTCPEMVVVPAGSFLMGSPQSEPERYKAEGPQVRVSITRPFAVGKFAVTFDEWDACVADGGCTHKPGDQGWGRGRRPVINVNWVDANQYARWLSRKTGHTYRLLSEAEREYVTRAGTTTPFWWGTSITPDQANYDGNYVYAGGGRKGEYRKRTVPVDSFRPNPWGLYNVHGNVWEWTADCWNDSHAGNPGDGTARTTGDCSRRVVRGGSWDISSQYSRSACRVGVASDGRSDLFGFRLARTLNP
ncbi:MAG: SUMF1/EgtB/PvdO family nonheme iron enzyme [Hyphomicrobiaceae bacterium]